jgi:hypothetical protein
MPLALTVFGVGKPGEQGRVCYAFVRSVRGPGNYPKPTLPKAAQTDPIRCTRLVGFDLEMVAWDHVLDEGMPAIEEAFSSGRLQIPSACPVEGARLLEGPIFGPLLLDEKPYRFRFAGVGNLLVRGMSIAGEPAGLLQHLSAAVGKYKLPRALAQLVDLLAVETGLGEFFIERRRLGRFCQHLRQVADTSRRGVRSCSF